MFTEKVSELEKRFAELETKSSTISSKSAIEYHNRGVVNFSSKKYEQAIAYYNQVIKLNPKASWAYHNRGLAYKALEQYDLAEKDFAKACELGWNG